MKNISLTALSPMLTRIAESVQSKRERYLVTRRGRPVMTIISSADFEGLLETGEVLSDKSVMHRVRKARKDVRAGKTVSLKTVQRCLAETP